MSHIPALNLESIAEGQAPSPEQVSHLGGCPECSRQLREMRKYFSMMKSLPQIKAPSGFSSRLRQRLEAEAAIPGWKKSLSALFSIRTIPLQLAGAGFAALMLFWALPRYQNLVPESESEVARAKPALSKSPMENATIDEKESEDDFAGVEKKVRPPEPPRPPLPKDLAAKKSVGGMGARLGAGAGRAEGLGGADQEAPRWSKTGDLAMIEVEEASTPEPVKSELPAASSPPRVEDRARESSASMKRKAATNQAAAPKATIRAEAKSSFESAPSMIAQESPASSPRDPSISTDSLLRSMGFRWENRKGRNVQILRLSKAKSDSVQSRLNDLGLEKLLILHALSNDSVEIEVR